MITQSGRIKNRKRSIMMTMMGPFQSKGIHGYLDSKTPAYGSTCLGRIYISAANSRTNECLSELRTRSGHKRDIVNDYMRKGVEHLSDRALFHTGNSDCYAGVVGAAVHCSEIALNVVV